MAVAAPTLEAAGLEKSYPGVRALHAVDLSVSQGEIVGLVGKNGAGKSTLIRVVAGAVEPDAGEVRIGGEPVALRGPGDARRHGVAVLHQELNIVGELSVGENLGLGGGYPRRGPLVDWGGLRRRAAEVLASVRLDDLDPRTPASQLSPVEQRLVMLAAALWNDARVFVLDEPTASLTDTEIERLHAILRELRDRGVAIVYVSHRLDEVLALADRAVVMRDGEIVGDLPTAGMEKAQLVEVISGVAPGGVVERPKEALPAGAEPVLEAEGIVRRGGRRLGGPVAVRHGEIVGLAGLVGSGRTSLLRALYGADPLDAGRVRVGGREVQRPSPRASLDAGLVLLTEDRRGQGLLTEFSVTDNVTLPVLRECRRIGRVPSPSRRREDLLSGRFIERLSIKTPSGAAPVKNLSGGNQQKVLMARWLAVGPKAILLDEPTAGIDVEAKEEVYGLMRELAAEGTGMLVACSDFAELAGICDRVYVLSEGRIVGELTGAEVKEERIVQMCFGEHGEEQR